MNIIDTGLQVRPNSSNSDEDLNFPKIEKPRIVGYFSVSVNRDFEPGGQNLRYYRQPISFPLDLNKGYKSRIKKPEGTLAHMEKIDNVLHFIFRNRDQFVRPTNIPLKPLVDGEFICYRGLLRMIMCTPYEFRNDWTIHVTKFHGNFYLCQVETEKTHLARLNKTEMEKRMCSWGFKFEQYCLTESPNQPANTDVPVDECSEFCCAFMTKLEGLELLYAAEMDGVISDTPVDLKDKTKLEDLNFIEIKVSQMDFYNRRQEESFNKFKSRNWWCQSFLVGIRDIYVGVRNQDGFVNRISKMEVRSLPKLGKEFWMPNTCFNFLTRFLNCIKTIMRDVNCPYTVYEFHFNPKNSKITYENLRQNTPHCILPDWYVSMIQRMTPNLVNKVDNSAATFVN